ncbi:MAG: hypothetical protein JWQ97_272 [Phenylobacterium sp.]|nr:hypothetical protein [Phenylobacterium sp.]
MTAFAEAAAAYKASRALDQRPAAVLAAVHQELALEISSAIAAYEAGGLDRMCRHAARSAQVLSALIAAVQGHSAEADVLAAGYARLRSALNCMLISPDDIKTIREGLDWTVSLSRSFCTEIGLK